MFNLAETKSHLELECQYNAELFDPQIIQGWLEQYRDLLAGLARGSRTTPKRSPAAGGSDAIGAPSRADDSRASAGPRRRDYAADFGWPGASLRPGATLTPTEQKLAAIWCEVLDLEQVGTADDFFDVGGHSLLATQVISRIAKVFHVELPLRTVFEASMLGALAEAIDCAEREQAEPGNSDYAAPPREPGRCIAGTPRPDLRYRAAATAAGSEAQRSSLMSADISPQADAPAERLRALLARRLLKAGHGGWSDPLSSAQHRLWFMDQFEPDTPLYNIPSVAHLTGALNLAALEQVLEAIVARHETLRTRFVSQEGEPKQIIDKHVRLPLQRHDLTALDEAGRQTEMQRLIREEASGPSTSARTG